MQLSLPGWKWMRGVLRTWREWFEVSTTFAEASKALQLAGSVLLPEKQTSTINYKRKSHHMFHFYPCKMDHFMVIVLLAKIKWAISIRTWQVFVLNASSCEPESVIDVTVVVAVLFSASTTATRNFFFCSYHVQLQP